MEAAVDGRTTRKQLWCGICEASCGLVAEVEDGRVTKLRPDPEHPNSRGFACSKGISFPQVVSDPDRVLHPLKRRPDGSFGRVSWETALDEIGDRLRGVIREHGTESVGTYVGNPNGWNYAAFMWLFGLTAALKTKHFYSAASVDINGYWLVSQLLYGNNMVNPVPDLERTDFFLCIGANPLVSHGSMMCVGRIRETMLAIPERGGRVVVVDPRRSETAQAFEHLAIRPDGDVWLLAALLKVVLEEGLADDEAIERQARGDEILPDLVAGVDLERAAAETGIERDAIVRLAREFATAPSAVAYGRCGASLGPFATLTKYLIDTLNLVTGNLDRPGGSVFGKPMLDAEALVKLVRYSGYDRWRTRVDGFPEILGTSPMVSMPREIRTPGKGQLRALLVGSGNIVTSSPASDDLAGALDELDLMVVIDPYLTETAERADYVLPPTLWLEREGFPIHTQAFAAVPYAQWTEATVPPAGDARDDWWIVDEICRRIGIVPSAVPGAQLLGKLGIRAKPAQVVDLFMRIGPAGDLFGLRRGGVSRRKLLRKPGGLKLADRPPTGRLRKHVHHRGGRVRLDHAVIREEMERLVASGERADPEYPLRLFSIRELRSHNSWLHNVPKLMAGDRVQRARIHPDDAAEHGIADGAEVEIASREGSIRVPATLSDEVVRGAVGLPQGWGHRGGWRRAVAAGGSNYNRLTPNAPDAVDRPSGNAVFNGIDVRVRAA